MGIYTKLTGVSHTQEILKTCKVKDKLKLIREPNNKYDKFAVAVYTKDNKSLGYISKYQNKGISQDMDRGIVFDCEIETITGKDQEFLGCNVHIYERELETKDIFVGDGFVKFSILHNFIVISKKEHSISMSNEDFEKCYNLYLRNKK